MDSFERKLYIKNFIEVAKKYKDTEYAFRANGIGLSALLASELLSYTVNDTFDVIKYLSIGALGFIDIDVLKRIHKITMYKVNNTPRIEDQPIYLECLKLYREYINRFCELLNKIDFNNSLELCYFLDNCFEDGIFSLNGISEYHSYSIDYDGRYQDLRGTRVLTGKSVCRHNACLSVDILQNFGKRAYYLLVEGVNQEERYERDKSSVMPLHAVTGIIDDNERFAFDFTWHVDSYFDLGYSEELDVDGRNNLYISPHLFSEPSTILKEKTGYILVKSSYYTTSPNAFFEAVDKKMTKADWDTCVVTKTHFYRRHYNELMQFCRDNNEILQRVATLSKRLLPCYDSKKR